MNDITLPIAVLLDNLYYHSPPKIGTISSTIAEYLSKHPLADKLFHIEREPWGAYCVWDYSTWLLYCSDSFKQDWPKFYAHFRGKQSPLKQQDTKQDALQIELMQALTSGDQERAALIQYVINLRKKK